uniref:tRNA guanosine-2'-O-methyltransferase TRM11 isogeny n=2 Tax=Cajanus cajan TaxID=3821 RepID=A0A151T2V0_CAJCA|nr:tRNA guanosine-2'-O-methyltransferase TRM11 isogeny [Cajanus cajan]
MLVMGGRLVFFYPVLREEEFSETHFPEHPCFQLISSSEQILSSRYSRVLLTMVKTGPYTEEIAEVARTKHMEFKENHVKWLEDGNLHSAIFSPADAQLTEAGDSKFIKDPKPKYRGKYV